MSSHSSLFGNGIGLDGGTVKYLSEDGYHKWYYGGSSGADGTDGTSGSSGTSGTSDTYATTSTTSFALGNSGTLTVGTGLAYTVGQSYAHTAASKSTMRLDARCRLDFSAFKRGLEDF